MGTLRGCSTFPLFTRRRRLSEARNFASLRSEQWILITRTNFHEHLRSWEDPFRLCVVQEAHVHRSSSALSLLHQAHCEAARSHLYSITQIHSQGRLIYRAGSMKWIGSDPSDLICIYIRGSACWYGRRKQLSFNLFK